MLAATPVTILVAALGGEGGGVLAEWLVATARMAGYPAQSTSIPGVAQRTGATTYYIEVYPQRISELRGRTPILSLLPVPGCIDLVVASELLEAVRTTQGGMVSAERTMLVTSTSRTLTTAEKMSLGDGRFDSELLLDVARKHSRAMVAFDMAQAASKAGTVMSAVMFGAIAGSGLLPFAREQFESVIRESGRGAQASLRGFGLGWEAVCTAASTTATEAPQAIASHPASAHAIAAAPAAVAASVSLPSVAAGFPDATQEFVCLGHARTLDFQDGAYAELYLSRLRRILAAETARRADAPHDFALTRETARFLALWMTFDDIVRVANLKVRAHRFARVRREVAADAADVVRIVDLFKPGVPEVAGLLPAALGHPLSAWDRRRQGVGKAPLALALHLRTDTVTGFLVLRTLAGLRWLRRRGTRYAQEQALIERWLGAIESAAISDWQCAFEIALCGRLIKGYGATNERGKRNLAHIVDHLATQVVFATSSARAAAIRQAREAALEDEGGKALDHALTAHGAPPRPVVAQPIRWSKRRPVGHAARPE
ncbi:MAG: indolepyruvate oxidoreductase subunit beta family protein [Betaproteobacteria bacterium]